jgi:hypothetical protein
MSATTTSTFVTPTSAQLKLTGDTFVLNNPHASVALTTRLATFAALNV